MTLYQTLEQLLSEPLFKFDGLTEKMEAGLTHLLLEHKRETLLEALKQLEAHWQEQEAALQGSRGQSGMAGERYMAQAMKVRYAHQSIQWVRQSMDNREPN